MRKIKKSAAALRWKEARRNLELEEELRWKRFSIRDILVMTDGNRDSPKLEWVSYRNLKDKRWAPKRIIKRLQYHPHIPQRCWFSGVLIHVTSWNLSRAARGWQFPWDISREHLVPARNGGVGHGIGNIKLAGRALNESIGHSPLPLKVLHKQELAKRQYDRETPVWDTYLQIKKMVIETENQFRYAGKYPWQNWAYETGSHARKVADAFAAEMHASEQEFLQLDDERRERWLAEFEWRW